MVAGEGQETQRPHGPGQRLHQGQRLHRLRLHPASQEEDVQGEQQSTEQRDGGAKPETAIAAAMSESQDTDAGQGQQHREPGTSRGGLLQEHRGEDCREHHVACRDESRQRRWRVVQPQHLEGQAAVEDQPQDDTSQAGLTFHPQVWEERWQQAQAS